MTVVRQQVIENSGCDSLPRSGCGISSLMERWSGARTRRSPLHCTFTIFNAVTCLTHRAILFSSGITTRYGPSLSSSGLPSFKNASTICLSVNAVSISGSANTTRYPSAASTNRHEASRFPFSASPNSTPPLSSTALRETPSNVADRSELPLVTLMCGKASTSARVNGVCFPVSV
jgi:hypothetical protein